MSSTGAETRPVSTADLASFTRQLGAMLDADVNVLRALRIASQNTGCQPLVDVSREIALFLEDGREFHRAIGAYPDLFDPFYVEMSRQGESDGLLGKALMAVADYLDRVAAGPGGSSGVHPFVLPAAPAGVPTTVAAMTMSTLGVLALGAGAIWAIAASHIIPIAWLGPLAVVWSGVCLLAGSWLLRRVRRPDSPPPAAAGSLPALPAKSRERQAAEMEAVVRVALEEQAEEEEAEAARASARQEDRRDAGQNGSAPVDASAFRPEDPPRFQL